MFETQIAAMQAQLTAMHQLAEKTESLQDMLKEAFEMAKESGLVEQFQTEIAVVVFPDKSMEDLREQLQAKNIASSSRLSQRKMSKVKKLLKSFFHWESEVLTPAKVRDYFVDKTSTNPGAEVEELMENLDVQFQVGKDTRDFSGFWLASKNLLEVLSTPVSQTDKE